MDADELIRRGLKAEQLLKDPLWTEAWEIYRLKLFSMIENAKTDEGTIRGKLMLGVANDVRTILEGFVKSGKACGHEIKLEEERKKFSFWSRSA